MRRASQVSPWMLALLACLGVAGRCLGDHTLLDRVPEGVGLVVEVRDAASLRTSPAGEAIEHWMRQTGAMAGTRQAWGLLADRVGLTTAQAFDRLLGARAVFALQAGEDGQAPSWLVLTVASPEATERLLRGARAVPRRVVHGRTVMGLEEESFLLAMLGSTENGGTVFALSPFASRGLLARTLAVSAGAARPLWPDASRAIDRSTPFTVAWFDKRMLTDNASAVHASPPGPIVLAGRVRGLRIALEALSPAGRPAAEFVHAPWAGEAETAPGFGRSDGERDRPLMLVHGPTALALEPMLARTGLGSLVPLGLTLGDGPGQVQARERDGVVTLTARLSAPGTRDTSRAIAPGPDAPWADAQTPDRAAAEAGASAATSQGLVHLQTLADTPAARSLFGGRAEMAWTRLDEGGRSSLVVAVAPLGPGEGGGGLGSAADLLVRAAGEDRPAAGRFSGVVRGHTLWRRLAAAAGPGGWPSVLALVEEAQWSFALDGEAVGGWASLRLHDPAGAQAGLISFER